MSDKEIYVNTAFCSDDRKLSGNKNVEDTEKNKMALKTTVVSLPDANGSVGVRKNTEELNVTECNGFHLILAVALVSVVIAFAVILAFYVKEIRKSDSSPTSHKTCFEEECISSAAGKITKFDFCSIMQIFKYRIKLLIFAKRPNHIFSLLH